MKGKLNVVRLNLRQEVGRTMWKDHALDVVPALMVFNRNGTEVWRQQGQLPDSKTIHNLMSTLQ